MVNTKTFDVPYLKRELSLPGEAIYETVEATQVTPYTVPVTRWRDAP